MDQTLADIQDEVPMTQISLKDDANTTTLVRQKKPG
jgi:hypothetical protein